MLKSAKIESSAETISSKDGLVAISEVQHLCMSSFNSFGHVLFISGRNPPCTTCSKYPSMFRPEKAFLHDNNSHIIIPKE